MCVYIYVQIYIYICSFSGCRVFMRSNQDFPTRCPGDKRPDRSHGRGRLGISTMWGPQLIAKLMKNPRKTMGKWGFPWGFIANL